MMPRRAATAVRRSARITAVALTLSAGFPVHDVASAEPRYACVVGRHYQNQILFCRSPAARNALIVLWQQGIPDQGRMPQGCQIEGIAFVVIGIARDTNTMRITTTGRAPGRFLVAERVMPIPEPSPRRIYVFFYSDVILVRTNDGRPGPELDDP
jgi:hypothetical protein